MNKVKSVNLLIMVMLLCAAPCFMTGCGNPNYEKLGREYDTEYDFQYFFGSMPSVQKVDKGYYFLLGEFLFYYDNTMEQACIVCNKYDCNHQNEECNAYLAGATEINYFNKKLYYIAPEEEYSENWYLFCVSCDGKRREKIVQVATLNPEDNGISFQMCVHRGKIFFSVLKSTNLKKRSAVVYEVELEGRHTWKEIDSFEGYGAAIDDIAAYGNTLVVLASYADSEEGEFRYHTDLVNLEKVDVKKDVIYDKDRDAIFAFMNKDVLYYYSDNKLFSKNINNGEEKCVSGSNVFYDEINFDGNYIYNSNWTICRENNDFSDYRIDIYDLNGHKKKSISMTENMTWLYGDKEAFLFTDRTDEKVNVKIYDKSGIGSENNDFKNILTLIGDEDGNQESYIE